MSEFRLDKEWLDCVGEQEEQLKFDTFDSEDAWQIGTRIVALAKEKYQADVAVSIMKDNLEVFGHRMAGTTIENSGWIYRKYNTCMATGVSSLRAALEIEYGLRKITWQGREAAFVACGGGWPVKMGNGDVYAYIIVSGLKHFDDHQIIVDALSDYLGKSVKSLAR